MFDLGLIVILILFGILLGAGFVLLMRQLKLDRIVARLDEIESRLEQDHDTNAGGK